MGVLPEPAPISFIIALHNQMELTQACLRSIEGTLFSEKQHSISDGIGEV
jgi:hypothetical protein